MLANNPYWKAAHENRDEYWKVLRRAPLKALGGSVLSSGAGIAAVEFFTHNEITLGAGAAAIALAGATAVYSETRKAVIDSNVAGVSEGHIIGGGVAFEEKLIHELDPEDYHKGALQLQDIWAADPTYRGGQIPEVPLQ